MEERAQFALDALRGAFSMVELCSRYEISRKTGYKWLKRYQLHGLGGCQDRSRAPATHPNATDPAIVAQILRVRRRYRWGPGKLRGWLVDHYPETHWPAVSTVGEILKRHGLIRPRRHRKPRTSSVWQAQRTEADRPNRIWSADFKGQFRLKNGVLCYPLTILDTHSRYLLACRGLSSTAILPARSVFLETFRTYGLPDIIHTDNGVPFCAPLAVLGLSGLSVWFLKLGIRLERSRPGRPQDNGRHERMHRTLKQEVARPPRATMGAQQRALGRFQQIYNEERPHEALQQKPPAAVYRSSPRPMPTELRDPEYPRHYETRWITKRGEIKWKNRRIVIGEALRHEHIGLEPIADGLWSVYFADILLGRFHESDFRFIPGTGC